VVNGESGHLVIWSSLMDLENGTLARRRPLRSCVAIGTRCTERLRKDRSQFVGFTAKGLRTVNDLSPDDEIKPVDACFGFLDHNGELRDEISARPCCAGRAIVRSSPNQASSVPALNAVIVPLSNDDQMTR
jgi:hypothetical protein